MLLCEHISSPAYLYSVVLVGSPLAPCRQTHQAHAFHHCRHQDPALDGHHRSLQEIKARIPARAFGAVHNPEQGPAMQQVREQLLAILGGTSTDGLI
jgi:hypothetical protein